MSQNYRGIAAQSIAGTKFGPDGGRWTRSRSLARPSRAFGVAGFLSPLSKRLKSARGSAF